MGSGYYQARWHPDEPNARNGNDWVDVLVLAPREAASEFTMYEFRNWGWECSDDFTEESMRVQVRLPNGVKIQEYIVTGEIEMIFTAKFKETT